MTPSDAVELVVDAHAKLGEGPIWNPQTDELLWVDILAKTVWAYCPATGANEGLYRPGYPVSGAFGSA